MKLKIILALLLSPASLIGQPTQLIQKKILVVVSSYGKDKGKLKPGFEFEEFAQAYLIFKANGLEVDVASPKGGYAEPDAFNKNKPYNKQVLEDSAAMALLYNTKPTAHLHPEHYAAVYIVGGKGAMFDLPFDPSLQELVRVLYQQQKGVVAAVCHGPAALVNVKLNDTSFLIANKTMTGFSNEEEDKFGNKWKSEFPFLLEDKLKARAVKYERAAAMLPQVTVDGKLITGQNPFSTTLLAEEIIKALGMVPQKRVIHPDERSIFLVKRVLSGDTAWARQELDHYASSYDTQLIAAYSYFMLLNASGNKKAIHSGLFLAGLLSESAINKNLRYQMAKAYLYLNNKESAKRALRQILAIDPSSTDAKKLLEELN